MRNQYRINLERELERLWVNKTEVFILDLGKDKYSITDGTRSVRAKGPILLRIMKPLPDKARAVRMWDALFASEEIFQKQRNSGKLVINT